MSCSFSLNQIHFLYTHQRYIEKHRYIVIGLIARAHAELHALGFKGGLQHLAGGAVELALHDPLGQMDDRHVHPAQAQPVGRLQTEQAGTDAAAAKNAAEAAEKLSKDTLARADHTAQTLADMPTVISGRAPCLKTGSLNLTRIYFPRPFATVPDVVPGIYDFGGNQRLVTMVGLTAEYVDLITNYWHARNTFTYIAIGRLAD